MLIGRAHEGAELESDCRTNPRERMMRTEKEKRHIQTKTSKQKRRERKRRREKRSVHPKMKPYIFLSLSRVVPDLRKPISAMQ